MATDYVLRHVPAPPARKAAAQTAGQKVNRDRKVQSPIAPAASSMRRAYFYFVIIAYCRYTCRAINHVHKNLTFYCKGLFDI